jgi:predicted transcriptional regulator
LEIAEQGFDISLIENFPDKGTEKSRITLLEALKIITDKYCTKILTATDEKPKSAIELSYNNRIPIAACYRRIRLLSKAGVIKCVDKVPSRKGKKKSLYLSLLKNSSLILEGQKLRVEFELKTGNIKEFVGEHKSIDTNKIE